jgi:hypothetical protein
MTEPPEQPDRPQPPSGSAEPAASWSPAGWRPSEADRRTIADRLRQAVNEGRLDHLEYDQRLRASERATTLIDLQAVVADLPSPMAGPEQVLAQLGEITVTPSIVYTPVGPIPLRGSQWYVRDQWLAQQKTPVWAIVLAIAGASLGVLLILCTFFISLLLVFCLLFLLAKETRFHGTVDVTVVNGNQQYVTRLPVQAQQQVHHIYHQVNYVRSLAAR